MHWVAEARQSGVVARNVRCEKCGENYHYLLAHTATAEALGGTPESAVANAENLSAYRVIRALENGTEIVPCPACGWVQAEMGAEMRRRYLGWVKAVALTSVVLGAVGWLCVVVAPMFVAGSEGEPWPVAGVWGASGMIGVGAVLYAVRLALRARVSPNRGYPAWPRPIPGAIPGIPGRASADEVTPRRGGWHAGDARPGG